MATKAPALERTDETDVEYIVKKGFALVSFLKPHFERDKDDKAFISYEMSLPLGEGHRKWVPAEIGEAWEIAQNHGYKVQDIKVENQVCDIVLSPDAKDATKDTGLRVEPAEIEQATISTIIEKGTGEEREVIRLKFRIRMDLDNESGRFARVHFGRTVWLKLQPLQRKLL